MIKKIAYQIRHLPGLSKAEWLWNTVRKPYHFLINIKRRGIPVKITDNLTIRIPPQYYSINLNEYEIENTSYLSNWIEKNPNCYILDIGCSIGYVSAICLTASKDCEVIAFDSDLASLKATRLMCQYSGLNRLHVVYGFISETDTSEQTIEIAIKLTNNELANSIESGDPGTTKYVNLDKYTEGTIPTHTIDSLYENYIIKQSKILIKCDIEGAELLMLKGAKNFITKYKPELLLSVHPDILPIFNNTVDQIKDFLSKLNYSIKVISIDHEEHWWCSPNIL